MVLIWNSFIAGITSVLRRKHENYLYRNFVTFSPCLERSINWSCTPFVKTLNITCYLLSTAEHEVELQTSRVLRCKRCFGFL